MIVLDTNVVSELHGRQFADRILSWLDGQGLENLFLTTIAVAELRFGLELLPHGKRKDALAVFLDKVEDDDEAGSWNFRWRPHIGTASWLRTDKTRPLETKDAMIAAICLSSGATLATRNTKDCAGLDLPLINPFEEL